MKTCSRCKEPKPLSEFSRDRSTKDGYDHRCKLCSCTRSKNYRTRFPEKVKERNRKNYPKRMLKNKIYCKRFNETHKDYKAAYNRVYYLKNKPDVLKQCAEYRSKNQDKVKSSNSTYNTSNKGRINRSNNRDKRKARINGASIIENIDRLAIYERDGGICHICHRKVSKKTFTLDHLIPVIHHGNHTAINVAIAHRGCNSRRGTGRIPAQRRLLA